MKIKKEEQSKQCNFPTAIILSIISLVVSIYTIFVTIKHFEYLYDENVKIVKVSAPINHTTEYNELRVGNLFASSITTEQEVVISNLSSLPVSIINIETGYQIDSKKNKTFIFNLGEGIINENLPININGNESKIIVLKLVYGIAKETDSIIKIAGNEYGTRPVLRRLMESVHKEQKDLYGNPIVYQEGIFSWKSDVILPSNRVIFTTSRGYKISKDITIY